MSGRAQLWNARTLQCLREEAKDVIDYENGRFRTARSSGVCLHAIDGDPFTLLLIAIADDRWNSAASV